MGSRHSLWRTCSGTRRAEAAAWDSLGYIHHRLGHWEQAIAGFRRSADLRHEVGDRYQEAQTLTRLGEVNRDGGDPDGARDVWRRALAILTLMRHPDADHVSALLAPNADLRL